MAYGKFNLPDAPLNPFRIKPPEGELMTVKKGGPDGPLDRIIASIDGWHFLYQETSGDPDDFMGEEWEKWELFPNINPVTGASDYTPPARGMLEEEFGIITVGFLRGLHIPHIRYVKWELKPIGTESGLVRKDRNDSPYFYFQYSMGIPVVEVESRGNIKTTIKMNIVVRIRNPYKAQFLAGGWESLLDAAVNGAVRDYISDLTIEGVRALKESDTLANAVKNLSGHFRENFGIEILDVRFVSFDIVGGTEIQNALTSIEVNRLKADAAAEKGREIRTLGDATAYAAEQLTKAAGSPEAAAQIRAAELIAEGVKGASVISIGGNAVPVTVPVPPKK